jgi:hypothetical protein
MKERIAAIAILALGCSCFAQSGNPIAPSDQAQTPAVQPTQEQGLANTPTEIQSCYYTFTSGTGNTYLSYCVTPTGNITYLETPKGYVQINHTYLALTGGEGYGFCDANTATQYYDWADFDSGNWDAITILSQTATAMKFARTTSDGLWTLTETITQVPSTSSVKIAMALKNNSTVARTAYLVRYADIDADNFNSNFGDGTGNSAFIWNTSPNPAALTQRHGLVLQNVGTPQLPAWDGFVQNTVYGPNPCAFANSWAGPGPVYADLSAVLAYVGSVPAKGTRTVTVSYKGL